MRVNGACQETHFPIWQCKYVAKHEGIKLRKACSKKMFILKIFATLLFIINIFRPTKVRSYNATTCIQITTINFNLFFAGYYFILAAYIYIKKLSQIRHI